MGANRRSDIVVTDIVQAFMHAIERQRTLGIVP